MDGDGCAPLLLSKMERTCSIIRLVEPPPPPPQCGAARKATAVKTAVKKRLPRICPSSISFRQVRAMEQQRPLEGVGAAAAAGEGEGLGRRANLPPPPPPRFRPLDFRAPTLHSVRVLWRMTPHLLKHLPYSQRRWSPSMRRSSLAAAFLLLLRARSAMPGLTAPPWCKHKRFHTSVAISIRETTTSSLQGQQGAAKHWPISHRS
mmetsp:Transcript_11951/g.19532  ORF Transcript_11951/g.19532 Transcript_11951/m.19532 type:complete len:205 (-) Transcript_11951:738-1352(-)